MRIEYHVQKNVREQQYIETGKMPAERQVYTLDDAKLTPEFRAFWLKNGGGELQVRPDSPMGYKVSWFAPFIATNDEEAVNLLNEWRGEQEAAEAAWRSKAQVALRQAIDGLLAKLDNDGLVSPAIYLEWTGLPGYDEACALQRAIERKRAEAQAQAFALAKAERERQEADKTAWIESHGSEKLQAKFAAGYDCQRLYVFQRAALEHPDFILDWHETARYKGRSCPSDAGFEEAKRVGGRVVWLIEPPSPSKQEADEYPENFEECEAVVLEDYLGKYTLVEYV
jgi:hypothetical protein